MNKRVYKSVGILALILTLTGSCSGLEQDPFPEDDICTISASIGQDGTRVSQEQWTDLSLISTWDVEDKFDTFVNKQEAEKSIPIDRVSDNGKMCTFTVNLSESLYPGDCNLFCATVTANAQSVNGTIFCNASIVRSPLGGYDAPVFARVKVTDRKDLSIQFGHYLVYEVLHVKNGSNQQIRFSHAGYDAEGGAWFYTKGAVAPEDGSFVTDSKAAREPVAKSQAISVNPGETGVIISAYRANGKKISGATLLAEVNGATVRSINTLSSEVELQHGHAYHMYAVWDGESLRFTNPNGDGGSSVDAGGSGYGSNDSGDVTGTGLGYGTDASGNLNGGGSGYGTDGSGDISSGGSGYGADGSGSLSGGGSGYPNGN